MKRILRVFHKNGWVKKPKQKRDTLFAKLRQLDLELRTPPAGPNIAISTLKRNGISAVTHILQRMGNEANISRPVIERFPTVPIGIDQPRGGGSFAGSGSEDSEAAQDCQVCGEDFPGDSFPLYSTAGCNHLDGLVCTGCLHTLVLDQIPLDQAQWSRQITCPGSENCHSILSAARVNYYIGNNATLVEQFDHSLPIHQWNISNKSLFSWERFVISDYLKDQPNFCWCRNPGGNPNHCHSGQFHPKGCLRRRNPQRDSNEMVCIVCRQSTCFQHDCPWRQQHCDC